MNAVEIEQAISALAEQPFDAAEFPFAFLQAFGSKEATIKRLRKGESNKSDLGGVLQTSNIHIVVADPGDVTATLDRIRTSPATTRAKVKFIVATDGEIFEAEDLANGESIACAYEDFPDHFSLFLPLAGISTVKQIRDSTFDIKATSRLNKLYIELLSDNPDWGTAEKRRDMNHFMARLIFCFFAEKTDIFNGKGQFTAKIEMMSARSSSNTHEVIQAIFTSMRTKISDRTSTKLPRWIDIFPYVNGGLFSGSLDVPRFSKIARSYLLHIGKLDWTKINPDIFGSMIQAVSDEEERGTDGMHYTSVPNILKVLNPLFLEDLRERLNEAEENPRILLNLRKRMSRIRVFDPACGSGNFLVIAYKEMRAIEAELNHRRKEAGRKSEIPLTNFRGIEIRSFPAQVARLALIIAEFQCDVLYRGQKEALSDFLPLDSENWITCGNAVQIDWLSICPATGSAVKLHSNDLFNTPLDQAQIDFENEGGETYICGNPPYVWTNDQTAEQKSDLKSLFAAYTTSWRALNYVSAWFMKLAEYGTRCQCRGAFVSINTICQGQHAAVFWPIMYALKYSVYFAHEPFKWKNLASNNAGVTVVIIGLAPAPVSGARLYSDDISGGTVMRRVSKIGPYLVPNVEVIVAKQNRSISNLGEMVRGNMPYEGGYLLLTSDEKRSLESGDSRSSKFIIRISGSSEIIDGKPKYCIWIEDDQILAARQILEINRRLDCVAQNRASNSDRSIVALGITPHRFREMNRPKRWTIAMPAVSSEARQYLPVELLPSHHVITNRAYGIYDGELYNLALLASTLHIVWVGTVCGKLELRYSYTNTLGWNTFPVPVLTTKNKEDLARCAEDILLARERYFPATISELYDVKNGVSKMPSLLREAHERADEIVERIYIGRKFRNDTERLEKLFDLYTKMTSRELPR